MNVARDYAESYLGWVAEPQALKELTPARPDPEDEPHIVGRYNTRPEGGLAKNPDGPWVWCSHCQKANHWSGFVVEGRSHEKHLIGGDCGVLHYGGTRFANARRDYTNYEKRQTLLRQLSTVKDAAADIANEVQLLLESSALSAVLAKAAELKKACPDALWRLAAAANAGNLTTHERVLIGPDKYEAVPIQLGSPEGQALLRGSATEETNAALAAIEELSLINLGELDNSGLLKLS